MMKIVFYSYSFIISLYYFFKVEISKEIDLSSNNELLNQSPLSILIPRWKPNAVSFSDLVEFLTIHKDKINFNLDPTKPQLHLLPHYIYKIFDENTDELELLTSLKCVRILLSSSIFLFFSVLLLFFFNR